MLDISCDIQVVLHPSESDFKQRLYLLAEVCGTVMDLGVPEQTLADTDGQVIGSHPILLTTLPNVIQHA